MAKLRRRRRSTRSRRAGARSSRSTGRSIGVFNVDGEYFALRNRCPHQGGPLCEGTPGRLLTLDRAGRVPRTAAPGEILRCPWHGWEFDIRTGQSWCDPRRLRVRALPTSSVEPGAALVAHDAPDTSESEPGLEGLVKARTSPRPTRFVEQQYVVIELAARGS